MSRGRDRTRTIATGALLVLAVIGLVDVLILLPGVLAPTTPLPEAWSAVAAEGDLLPVLVGPALWGLACCALAAQHLRARRPSAAAHVRAVALVQLGVLSLLLQGAAFGLGLWLSDHLPPYEGGTTAVERVLLPLGGAAIVAGLLLLVPAAVRTRKRPARS